MKSRAQATGEDFFLIRKIFELTFHLTERSVQHVGLVYCKNHSKLLENVHPDLDHDPVYFPDVALSSWDLEKIDPAGEVDDQACDDGWEYVKEHKDEQVEDCPPKIINLLPLEIVALDIALWVESIFKSNDSIGYQGWLR